MVGYRRPGLLALMLAFVFCFSARADEKTLTEVRRRLQSVYRVRSLLLDRTEDPEEKARLESIALQLRVDLMDMLKKDGLFTEQGEPLGEKAGAGLDFSGKKIEKPRDYPSSPGYVNPLAGLALLPLLDACDGKKAAPSSGILDSALEARVIPPGGRNARKRPGKNHGSKIPS